MAHDHRKRDDDARQREAEAQARTRERAILALGNVMRTGDGQEALWYVLDHTGLFAAQLWEPGVAINRRVAIRDFGAWLMNEMIAADQRQFFEIQARAHKRALEEQTEGDAA